jgi:hypothetical protein
MARSFHRLSLLFKAAHGSVARLGAQLPRTEPNVTPGSPAATLQDSRWLDATSSPDTDGVTLRGWFYPADGVSDTAPTIILANAYSAVTDPQ